MAETNNAITQRTRTLLTDARQCCDPNASISPNAPLITTYPALVDELTRRVEIAEGALRSLFNNGNATVRNTVRNALQNMEG